MEFVVPQADSSAFFPISVRFTATDTFSDLKVRMFFFLFFCFCIQIYLEQWMYSVV